jgi:hypothetical protein
VTASTFEILQHEKYSAQQKTTLSMEELGLFRYSRNYQTYFFSKKSSSFDWLIQTQIYRTKEIPKASDVFARELAVVSQINGGSSLV